MDPGLIWIIVGLVLLGAELLLPGVFLMWVGLAAVAAGLYTYGDPHSFAEAVLVFLAALVASIGTGLAFQRRPDPALAELNTPTSGLLGRHGTVLVAQGRELRIRLGDSDWAARPVRDVPGLVAGARVRVIGVDGTTLLVRPD